MKKFYLGLFALMALFMGTNLQARTLIKTTADVKFTVIPEGTGVFPENATWYEMKIKANNKNLYYNSSNTLLPAVTLLEGKQTAGLFCFVGSADACQIYSYDAGATKGLSASALSDTTYVSGEFVQFKDMPLSFKVSANKELFSFNETKTNAFIHLMTAPGTSQITLQNYPEGSDVLDSCQFQLIELTPAEVINSRKQAIYGSYSSWLNCYGGFSDATLAHLKELCYSETSTFDEIDAEKAVVDGSTRIREWFPSVNYRIISNNNTEYGMFSMVDTTKNEMLYWKHVDTSDSRMLFMFEPSDTEGQYYIKNVATGLYVGDVFKSQPVAMTVDKTFKFTVEPNDPTNGNNFGFKCVNPTNNPDKPYLHGAGMAFGADQHAVVGWGPYAGPSRWRLQQVSGSYLKISMPQEAFDPAMKYFDIYYNQTGKALNVPTGVTAYAVTSYEKEKADLTQISVINENEAVLVYGVPGTYSLEDATEKATAKSLLVGVEKETAIQGDGYVLFYDPVDDSSNFMFANSYILPAGSAYLKVADNSNGDFLFFSGFTGISSVSKDAKASIYYDLQGRRVSKPTKGVYIIGNKKVVK